MNTGFGGRTQTQIAFRSDWGDTGAVVVIVIEAGEVASQRRGRFSLGEILRRLDSEECRDFRRGVNRFAFCTLALIVAERMCPLTGTSVTFDLFAFSGFLPVDCLIVG